MKATTPAGLGAQARAFWKDKTDNFELGSHELLLLEQACRTLDDIAMIAKAVKPTDMIVAGSMGQPAANPLLQELRQHRQSFRQLVVALKFPEEPDETPRVPKGARTSSSARAAAQKRWVGVGAS